jgi:DNA-binding NtrC family response regulator
MKNELIFLVDDMPDVLALAKTILNAHGYENVVDFNSPDDALESTRKGVLPSIVISDYNMPEMNGIEFLNEVSSIHPKVRGVIMTADASLVESDKFPVIQKDKLIRINSEYLESLCENTS